MTNEQESEEVQRFKATKIEAEQGDADAQWELGYMYAEGRGVEKNDKEAAKWFQKAAEQGDADAQYELGRLYAKGKGVEKNDKEAAKWFRKAAEQGRAKAQWELGQMYYEGKGVDQDYEKAMEWIRKAAETDKGLLDDAQVKLGKISVEAEKRIREAAEKGDLKAQVKLGEICRRDGDYSEAIKWFSKANEQLEAMTREKENENERRRNDE